MRNKFPTKPVFIIDDEEQFLYSISLSLRANGISNVITCMTGMKAKEYISTMAFSVIVLMLTCRTYMVLNCWMKLWSCVPKHR